MKSHSLGSAGGGGAGAGFEEFEAEGRLPLKLRDFLVFTFFVFTWICFRAL